MIRIFGAKISGAVHILASLKIYFHHNFLNGLRVHYGYYFNKTPN